MHSTRQFSEQTIKQKVYTQPASSVCKLQCPFVCMLIPLPSLHSIIVWYGDFWSKTTIQFSLYICFCCKTKNIRGEANKKKMNWRLLIAVIYSISWDGQIVMMKTKTKRTIYTTSTKITTKTIIKTATKFFSSSFL